MPVIKTKTTYMQMFTPPRARVAAPRPDIRIAKLDKPSLDDYRRLYRGVGSQLNWVDRLVMKDDELLAILHHADVDVFVLTDPDGPLGYAELDRRVPGEIELAYFGLFPKAIGQGLGKYLLNHVLHLAWSHAPRRVWVHTCDLDHPAAIPNYEKAGFVVYDEAMVDQWLPDSGEVIGGDV